MEISLSEVVRDALWLRDQVDDAAVQRLDLFTSHLTAEDIQRDYLDLAKVFWQMPYEQSVDLAHAVIERFLLPMELWADLYLWSLSALRAVPRENKVWKSRNFLAISLQALGLNGRARDILQENLISKSDGSAHAYQLLFDPEFANLKAEWLDRDLVNDLKADVATVYPSGNQVEDERFLQYLVEVDFETGLTSYLLDSVAKLELPREARDNALLAYIETTLSHLNLDQPHHLVNAAEQAEARGEDASVALELLTLAATYSEPRCYLSLIRILRSVGLNEQAKGYAEIAVWRNIQGSANEMISLLGIEGTKVSFPQGVLEESEKLSLTLLASGKL